MIKFSPSDFGFIRVAVVSPEMQVADVEFNSRVTLESLGDLAQRGCSLALFPELGLTGYSNADLFYQTLLLDQARAALSTVARATELFAITAVIGLPLAVNGRLYNCAALVSGGKVLGIVPKTYLPNTDEYYEQRWFTSSIYCNEKTVDLGGEQIPLGTDLLFQAKNLAHCLIGIEICEDLWAPSPPSSDMVSAGATILLNLSASNELLGKADYRRDLVKQQSARCLAAYLYTSAGPNESTTDIVFSGHSLIAENGTILAETERLSFDTQIAIADVDLQRLVHERLKNSSFSTSRPRRTYRLIPFQLPLPVSSRADQFKLERAISPTPFVPSDLAQRAKHCREIFAIQSTGLAKRLKHLGARQISLGLSGGLDSTLALLVTIKAFDQLNLPRQGIVAVTMPGFGTTNRTHTNAEQLANLFQVNLRVIPIYNAVRQHFQDIGHDEQARDVTFENAQARERTQILMDLANQIGGITIGTGDLSEVALGWSTYNGDQMSMYNVNSGVPKTLVKYLVEWCADGEFSGEVSAVLHDICATLISPELLPSKQGDVAHQSTEDTIGPFLLHDFFLHYTVRYLFSPRKIFYLAQQAFDQTYSPDEILKWMRIFYQRFFAQQFKRSAMPDGPKVGSVALSPRGDWRMPSDASNRLWLEQIDELRQNYD